VQTDKSICEEVEKAHWPFALLRTIHPFHRDEKREKGNEGRERLVGSQDENIIR